MAKQDYYQRLGVPRDANADDIKKAYRKLAMQHHPDRNPGDANAEQLFKDINEAYDILKDDEKRAAYDRFGHAAFDGGMGGGRGPGGGPFDFGSFSDILNEFFGGGGGPGAGAGSRARGRADAGRGGDLRYDMQISLEEAYAGKSSQIRVPSSESCDACNGTGAEAGAKPITCPTCGGRGSVRATQGFFTVERPCHTCGGAGQIIDKPCRKCGGAGRLQKNRTLSVNIPPGVDDGNRLRLAGEGEAGLRGAPSGDLYIFIHIKPHSFYQREGANLYARIPLSMATAALGGVIEVPTLDGARTRVTIPPGTQSGKQFRLKGKGMPILQRSGHGDLTLQVLVETPVNLTEKQRDLLRQFERAGGPETSPEASKYRATVKE